MAILVPFLLCEKKARTKATYRKKGLSGAYSSKRLESVMVGQHGSGWQRWRLQLAADTYLAIRKIRETQRGPGVG